MTADPALLTRKECARLLERLAELDELDREMRRPGLLPGSAEPPPLCRASRKNATGEGIGDRLAAESGPGLGHRRAGLLTRGVDRPGTENRPLYDTEVPSRERDYVPVRGEP